MKNIGNIIKKEIDFFQNSKKQGFQYALFFALNLVLLFNPISKENVKVLHFNRTFGRGFIYDWDCSRLITNFLIWFILFSVLLFCFWIFFNWFKNLKFNDEQEKIVNFLDNFFILGCVNTLFKVVKFFSQKEQGLFLDYTSILVLLILLTSITYITLFSEKISFDFYSQILVSIFSVSFAIYTGLKKTNFKELVYIQLILFTVSIYVLKFINLEKNTIFKNFVKSSALTFSFVPLATSLYFELLNIMNAHSIFVNRIGKYYGMAFFMMVCVSLIFTLIIQKNYLKIDFWKRISFPVLVVGIAMIVRQPALSQVYGADIFESANLSIPVSDFLNFGKIPVVNNYPGHMMTGVWQAFIYSFFNNDKFGAIFSPYSAWLEFPIIALMFFYFVKTILNEEIAFFSVLIFPFAENWQFFGMGMLLPLSVIFYLKRQSYKRVFLIWISFVWCALYRLDMGFAFFCATFVSLAVFTIFKKDKKTARQLAISFLISASIGFLLWGILCISQNVNPILRFFEFIKLSASNLTWAYSHIGNSTSNLFVWCYFIVPFFIAVGLFFLIFSKNKNNVSTEIFILALIFGFSYFFNFPRGLVRHSLAEMGNATVLWCGLITIALFISIFFKKTKLFLPLFSILILMNTNFYYGTYFGETNILENVTSNITKNVNESRVEKKQRVIFEQGMKSWCDSYKFVMDNILKEDETFIDFMNRTFVYSTIGRKNPVYVAQSPLMLSGEFTQRMFIREISDDIDKIPVAILPLNDNRASASLDGILNSYRYYLVSEFIFSNYKPMFKYSDFAVWVKNDRYDEIKEMIQGKKEQISLSNFLYAENFLLNSCVIDRDFKNETFELKTIGRDPYFYNMNDFIDISKYLYRDISLDIKYESDTKGIMQLFYTTEENENYSEEKSVSKVLDESGIACFPIPITKFTKFRLDIPENSNVKILEIAITEIGIPEIDWNYDQNFHNYTLAYLPLFWGEKDSKKAINNAVIENLSFDGDVYQINFKPQKTSKGNYLHLKIDNQNQECDSSVEFGLSENKDFNSKFIFNFKVLNGEHDYIFRVSSDYLWYFENINSFKLNGDFSKVESKLLEAD